MGEPRRHTSRTNNDGPPIPDTEPVRLGEILRRGHHHNPQMASTRHPRKTSGQDRRQMLRHTPRTHMA